MTEARLSTRGRVVIPKSVRDRRGLATGTVLEIVDGGEGVLLRLKSRPAERSVAED
jgi:AbrB family looped-hinge helix DNA binding protein